MDILVFVVASVIISVTYRYLFPPRGPSFLRRVSDIQDPEVHP